jgi:hypothetical protein
MGHFGGLPGITKSMEGGSKQWFSEIRILNRDVRAAGGRLGAGSRNVGRPNAPCTVTKYNQRLCQPDIQGSTSKPMESIAEKVKWIALSSGV